MEKVKLPKVKIDAIDDMKAKGCCLAEIVSRKISNNLYCVNNWQTVKELDTDTLIRALYIGYEVEETPADKIRALYAKYDSGEIGTSDYRLTFHLILRALDIEVEGVNA